MLTIFINFLDFLTFPCYKETNDVSIQEMMLALFYFKPTLNRLFSSGKVKHKLRVQIHKLRVQIHELRVQIHELPVKIQELRVQIHKLQVEIHELQVEVQELLTKIHDL